MHTASDSLEHVILWPAHVRLRDTANQGFAMMLNEDETAPQMRALAALLTLAISTSLSLPPRQTPASPASQANASARIMRPAMVRQDQKGTTSVDADGQQAQTHRDDKGTKWVEFR